MVSDWKKAAWSLREEAEDSRAGGTTLFSGDKRGGQKRDRKICDCSSKGCGCLVSPREAGAHVHEVRRVHNLQKLHIKLLISE